MFWCGDSKTVVTRKRWLSIWYQGGIKTVWREEVLCGYDFGISLHCILWYMMTVYLCFILKGHDVFLMTLMLGKHGWEDFCKKHYYRCPLCRVLKYWKQVRLDRWH